MKTAAPAVKVEEPKKEPVPAVASPAKAEAKSEHKSLSWSTIAGTKPAAPVTQKPVARPAPVPAVAPVQDKTPGDSVSPTVTNAVSHSRNPP